VLSWLFSWPHEVAAPFPQQSHLVQPNPPKSAT
jgi:hypothetical protein